MPSQVPMLSRNQKTWLREQCMKIEDMEVVSYTLISDSCSLKFEPYIFTITQREVHENCTLEKKLLIIESHVDVYVWE